MAPRIDFTRTTVPAEYQGAVDRLRKYLKDTAEQNDLELKEESTDLELYQAMEDAWDEINYTYPPITLTFDNIVDIP